MVYFKVVQTYFLTVLDNSEELVVVGGSQLASFTIVTIVLLEYSNGMFKSFIKSRQDTGSSGSHHKCTVSFFSGSKL